MCLNSLWIQPEESNCIVLVNSLYLFSKKPRIQIYLLMVLFLFLILWNQGQVPLAHSNIRLYWKSSWCKFRHFSVILRLECWEDSMAHLNIRLWWGLLCPRRLIIAGIGAAALGTRAFPSLVLWGPVEGQKREYSWY